MNPFFKFSFSLLIGFSAIATAQAQFVQLGGDINGISAGDRFGEEIFLSGDGQHIAISALGRDTARGEVRVYAYSNGNWQQRGAALVSGNNNGQFGNDVALSADGSRLIIAQKYNNTTADSAGMVATYNWDGSTWTATTTLYGSHAQQLFGASIGLSSDGQTMIVGAPQYRNTRTSPAPPEGRAMIYSWSNTTNNWALDSNIEADTNSAFCGSTVDISPDGRRAIVYFGPFQRPLIPYQLTPSGRIFDLQPNNATIIGGCCGENNISFGRSLAISNPFPNIQRQQLSVFGAPDDGQQIGSIYFLDARAHHFTGPLYFEYANGDSSLYGYAVDVNANGNRMVIGEPAYSPLATANVGRAYLYEFDSGNWQTIFTPNGDQANAECGRSVSLSDDGRYLAVGCAGRQNSTGTVRVYFVPALSVATLSAAQNFKIYPNPAQDILFLERADFDKNATLAITNTLGQVLIQTNINSDLNEIPIESLPQGAYFAQISTADGLIFSQKIIKN